MDAWGQYYHSMQESKYGKSTGVALVFRTNPIARLCTIWYKALNGKQQSAYVCFTEQTTA